MASSAATLEPSDQGTKQTKQSRWRRSIRKRPGLLPGGLIVLAVALVAMLSPVLAPYKPNQTHFHQLLRPPSSAHWLGTDNLGRDVLSRLIAGTGASVLSALAAVLLAIAVGTIIGLLAGYIKGSLLDEVLMRIMDALLALPPLVLAIALAFTLGNGLFNAALAIAVVFTPQFARLARSKTLQVSEQTYVEAARSAGASPLRIMTRHVLPNIMGPSLATGALLVASATIIEASLSFLGLGLAPPAPTWGFIISSGVMYIDRAPWLVFAPSVAIAIVVYGFTLVGRAFQERR